MICSPALIPAAMLASIALLSASFASAADKTIGVFVALADNQHQGIIPVPAAIGNGDDPERNLYWGTAEGLKGFFDRNKKWKLIQKDDRPPSEYVLRTRTYRHINNDAVLYAQAYRGLAIRKCIEDFESAIELGSYDMVGFIGHNALMDFDLPKPAKSARQAKRPNCIVLCCKSEPYFKSRIVDAGGRPVLLTSQLMYPGSFLLAAAVESWLGGSKLSGIRESAGVAYAENQRLTKTAGMRVFAELGD